MTFNNAIKFFQQSPTTGEEAAECLRLLLAKLGNPERRIRVLPVTGDKGKSSIARMLVGMLNRSGIAAGALLYPCLSTPRDNVYFGDEPIGNTDFVAATSTLSSAVREISSSMETPYRFSQNELLFCLAFLLAEKRGCKWMVLEIPNGPFSPLSAIRFSAQLILITTSSEEGLQKAISMIHPGLNEVVSAPLGSNAQRILRTACVKANCRLTIPTSSELTLSEVSLRRTAWKYRKRDFVLPQYGESAILNALTAIEAADALRRAGCPVTEDGEYEGLKRASLPARAEIISVAPTIIVDAACDLLSEANLISLLKRKGLSLGSRITLYVEDGNAAPQEHFRTTLLEDGFSFNENVSIPLGEEHRAAQRIVKNATPDDLILVIGRLPFAFTMRTELRKVFALS